METLDKHQRADSAGVDGRIFMKYHDGIGLPKGQAADIHINVDGATSQIALFLDLKLKPPPR